MTSSGHVTIPLAMPAIAPEKLLTALGASFVLHTAMVGNGV